MSLLLYGDGLQPPDWYICEKNGPGYSRIYYINGGTTVYTDALGKKQLQHGRLYVFPAHAPYQIETDPDNPIDCLFLHMDVFPSIKTDLSEIDPAHDVCFSPILESIRLEIRSLLTLQTGKQELHYLAALTEALYCLLRREGHLRASSSHLLSILNYIDRNSSRPLTVIEISREFGYAPEYFTRRFTQALGMSPYQYLTAHRMNRAIELLRTPMKIAEIALASGYSDARAFSHAFRRRYGVSPREFRSCFIYSA